MFGSLNVLTVFFFSFFVFLFAKECAHSLERDRKKREKETPPTGDGYAVIPSPFLLFFRIFGM